MRWPQVYDYGLSIERKTGNKNCESTINYLFAKVNSIVDWVYKFPALWNWHLFIDLCLLCSFICNVLRTRNLLERSVQLAVKWNIVWQMSLSYLWWCWLGWGGPISKAVLGPQMLGLAVHNLQTCCICSDFMLWCTKLHNMVEKGGRNRLCCHFSLQFIIIFIYMLHVPYLGQPCIIKHI